MTAKKPAPAAQQEAPPEINEDLEAELDQQAEVERAVLDLIAKMTAPHNSARYDQRWLAIARTQIEMGFMALARATVNDG